MRTILASILAALAATIITVSVTAHEDVSRPVCHSVTEDGPIRDCDYRDGGWWVK